VIRYSSKLSAGIAPWGTAVQLSPTPLPGCVLLRPKAHRDARGWFIKSFHRPEFTDLGLPTEFAEEFHTVSVTGVLRGLHFQRPPHDHTKIVGCSAGTILDIVLDLRAGSPTYRQHHLIRLDATDGVQVLIPSGFAHGFLALDGPAVVTYRTTNVHVPEADTGVHWSSIGISWAAEGVDRRLYGAPLVSARDEHLPLLDELDTPFHYDEATLIPR
jgi:dTDP-4-dehydrorhamnose 3,5-epimerase